jgi:hypothetical protein
MTHRILLAFCIFQFITTTVTAGPWLRDKGSSFTSFSISSSADLDARSSGYFEFGITSTSTVGLDLGGSAITLVPNLGMGHCSCGAH